MTTEQKKAKADKLAILKNNSCCHKCNKRGHFHRDSICSEYNGSDNGDSSPIRGHRSRTKTKSKRSQANVTSSSIREYSSDSLLSPSESEAYVVTSSESSQAHLVWYDDSGATEHMTDKRHWFQKNSPLTDHCWSVTDQCWNLKVANDFTLWVRGVGDVVVTATVNGTLSTIHLKDVIYVPKI